MLSLTERIATDRVRMTTTYVDTGPDENGWMRHVYKVTLRRKGRQWTLSYYSGIGNVGNPEVWDVLNSILSNSSTYFNSSGFWDWAEDLEYPTDDPEDEKNTRKIYKAVQKEALRLEKFLNGDLMAYLEGTDWQN